MPQLLFYKASRLSIFLRNPTASLIFISIYYNIKIKDARKNSAAFSCEQILVSFLHKRNVRSYKKLPIFPADFLQAKWNNSIY